MASISNKYNFIHSFLVIFGACLQFVAFKRKYLHVLTESPSRNPTGVGPKKLSSVEQSEAYKQEHMQKNRIFIAVKFFFLKKETTEQNPSSQLEVNPN